MIRVIQWLGLPRPLLLPQLLMRAVIVPPSGDVISKIKITR